MVNAIRSSLIGVGAHGMQRRLVGVGAGLLLIVMLYLAMQALIKGGRGLFSDVQYLITFKLENT